MPSQLLKLAAAPDLVDQAYRALVDAINDGSLAPGERITQEDLARRLAVSRQPVLQALRLLKKDGLVLDAPGRGVLVAPLDPEHITHLYQVRGALDALAARLAAARRVEVDPALIERGRKAVRARNVRAMIEADAAFHHAVYAASGNELIEASARLHWQHIRRAMGAVLQHAGWRDTVWDEHEAIAAAIAAGEARRAEQLMSAHGERAGEFMARELAARAQGYKRQRGDKR